MTAREAYLATVREQSQLQMDTLADLVADGLLLKDAAKVLGIGEARVWRIWKKVKDDLGWQAA